MTTPTLLSRFAPLALSLLAASAVPTLTSLAAQQPTPSASPTSSFVVKKGKDTVAIETFNRTASQLTGEISQTNGVRTQYTLTLRPDSSVVGVELMRQGRQGPGMGVVVHFGDTLVTASISAGGEANKLELPVKGKAAPFLAVSFAIAEQLVQASHLAPGKSATWMALRLGAGDTATLTVSRFHADSVLLSMPDVQIKLALSSKGEVIGGRHMAQDWIVERRNGK